MRRRLLYWVEGTLAKPTAQMIEISFVVVFFAISVYLFYLAALVWHPKTLGKMVEYFLLVSGLSMIVLLEIYVAHIKPKFQFLMKYGFDRLQKKKSKGDSSGP